MNDITPTLPKGYYFNVRPGAEWMDSFEFETYTQNARVEIKKKHWWESPTIAYAEIPNTVHSHPTQDQVYEAMQLALGKWDKIREEQAKETIYGKYPPKKLYK